MDSCYHDDQHQVTHRGALITLLVVIAFLAIVRLRIAGVALERDEGEYAYAGQLILQGVPPYRLVYNMKFPGVYYAYSVILALFGQTAWGIHAGLLCVNAATVLIIYFLARRLLDDGLGAVVAAATFGILSIDRWIMGVFAHATHFVVLAAMSGLLVLFHALESKRTIAFIGAGLMLGLSVLMKQNGIFFLAFGLGATVWIEMEQKPKSRGATARIFALVVVSSAIPFMFMIAVLLAQGVFQNFWFWTFQYAKEYVSLVPVSEAIFVLAAQLLTITRANYCLWVFSAAGMLALWMTPWPRQTRFLLTAFLATSVISTVPGFYFRAHYFILLLPAVALFTGVAVISIANRLANALSSRTARTLAAAVFVAISAAYIGIERDYLFSMPVFEVSKSRYGSRPFVEALEIADYIRARTSPSDRIGVLGSEPEIYFYANRISATGYVYVYGLMEQQRYSVRMQEEMIDELNAGHPKYLVFVDVRNSWLGEGQLFKPDEKILAWSKRYLQECYELVGIADIPPSGPATFVWENVASYRPHSDSIVYTYRSRTETPCSVPIKY